MKNMPIYEALAQAFAAEGVAAQFTLMGDGNMHHATAMKNIDGMDTFSARHEHCACAMAMGYHLATGKVGVASVTCGPGFTQIMTALSVASRGQIPLVVFAGEAPINAKWYNQALDQPPFAAASGAHYISAHSPQRMYQYVREAFYLARHERKPVVLGVPYDLQKQPLPNIGDYQPSSDVLPHTEPIPPSPDQIEQLAEKLAGAKCPIILAGRGVMRSGAAAEVEALAEQCGALLATTLLARGMFDHNPFSLGVAGGFAREVARELGEQADLVVAIGASLNYYTVDGGHMFPKAEMVQIDTEPLGLHNGMRAADRYVRADAKLAAAAALDGLRRRGAPKASIRSPEVARRIRERACGQRAIPDRAGPARSATRDRRARSRDPQGLRFRQRRRPPVLLPLDHARPQARELPRHAGVRRDRQRHLARHRRRRGEEERQDGAVRGRRQPVDAHPGTGDGAAARFEAPHLRTQRRRLWLRGPQAARRRHRRQRVDLRADRPRRPLPRGSGCAARPSPTSTSSSRCSRPTRRRARPSCGTSTSRIGS